MTTDSINPLCARTQSELKAFIDKESGWFGKRRIDRHLQTCHDCKRELDVMQKLTSFVQQVETVDPPADFRTQVMTRIVAEIQNSRQARTHAYRPERHFTGWAPVFAFVAGVALMWMAHHRIQVSSAKNTSLSVVTVRLQVRDRAALEAALGSFGPVSRQTSSPPSFTLRIPQENAGNLFQRLSQLGKVLEPRSLSASLSQAQGWVEMRIVLVTQ